MGASFSSLAWSEDAQPNAGSSATSHHGSDSNVIAASSSSSSFSPKPSKASSLQVSSVPASAVDSDPAEAEVSPPFQLVSKKRSTGSKRKYEIPSPSKLATMPYKYLNESSFKFPKSSHSTIQSYEGDKASIKSPPHILHQSKSRVSLIIEFQASEDYSNASHISDDFREFKDCQHLVPHHHKWLDDLIAKEQAKAAPVSHSDKMRCIIRAVWAHFQPKLSESGFN